VSSLLFYKGSTGDQSVETHPKSDNKTTSKNTAFFTVLSSTRDYSEVSVRLEVQVPTVGKPSKSEDSDTQGARGAKRCRLFFK
jgi:hypothetical protein